MVILPHDKIGSIIACTRFSLNLLLNYLNGYLVFVYGVDINPLAVDLCKVGLWIEGFCSGNPKLLDHRIKCGNSLVGVLDLECLEEGIPDSAFKAISGDDKKIVTGVKKRNKKGVRVFTIGDAMV